VDSRIGQIDYVNVTTRGGQFSPNTDIEDARQRWLFRMVHSQRPLQEKMALFWHNHFATGYSKLAGAFGTIHGTKMMALKPGALPGRPGQIELFRRLALGNFRNLLIEVARDPAMLVWLDGRQNVRAQPQENFAREIMELFTWGVGNYTEQDVYAAARVFTGWNLRNATGGLFTNPNTYYEFVYNPGQHDTTAKAFTFPIYSDGNRTIPARSSIDGMQDGIDFITALAQAVEFLRQRIRQAGPRVRRSCRLRILAQRDRDEAGHPLHPAVRVVFRLCPLVRPLFVADGVRRACHSRDRVVGLFG
jgi:uncharacterized protein (DUF1800 family)